MLVQVDGKARQRREGAMRLGHAEYTSSTGDVECGTLPRVWLRTRLAQA
jgi:hypothetical protein